ncbi:molybdenum cofactor guanylyltransferase [Rhodococcus sp. D2-41]|uniref:Probable molybdenum cofactor guanylyltransferase n=1 Tax=Speluncibacter jeojiensis TaxID=2710754 RepID=A0A9X4LZ82_9ACTN|nr:molybdenum cofactor guanylyltransferase [Rhodococcus sp. D2-41]MDG3008567.1 molybdenum cofactor guanylyltransferase [Rhodococcus sp. D2-41]MDG3013227.1 molybdenum cofactor guanylyltransferase [Corynebacteriales bacterium D3-21]
MSETPAPETERVCGIVLVGGRSRRMGSDKSALPWGSSTLLGAIVDTLRGVFEEVVVVAAPGQRLPEVAARIVRDEVADEGPLRGLATGLAAAVELGATATYVTATDTPNVVAALIRSLVRGLNGDVDAVLAHDGDRDQPLVAVYRTTVLSEAREALESGERSMMRFVAGLRVARVQADPAQLVNLNTRRDFERAQRRAARG